MVFNIPHFKKLITLLSASAIAITVLSACDEQASTKTSKRKPSSPTVATFSRGKVTEEEFKEFTSQLSKAANITEDSIDEKTKESLVREIVARELVEKEARKLGINKDPEIKETVKEFQAQLIRQKYLEQITKEAATEEKVKDRYDTLAKELNGKDEIKVRHILVKDKATADNLRKQLASGASFAKLAKQYSLDTGTKDKGGDLGYFVQGRLNKAFETAAFSLKKGEISQPSSTGFGWHIIEVQDRRPAKPVAFDQAKNVIQQQLKAEFIKDHMKNMVENANIRIKETAKEEPKQNDI